MISYNKNVLAGTVTWHSFICCHHKRKSFFFTEFTVRLQPKRTTDGPQHDCDSMCDFNIFFKRKVKKIRFDVLAKHLYLKYQRSLINVIKFVFKK